jgi:hypothetical protein
MESNGKLGFARLACLVIGCASLVVACGDDDDGDGGSGSAKFGCESAGQFCILYTGPSSNIDAIRDASNCEDQGAVEVDSCPTGDAAVCSLTMGGASVSQYYYGLEADDIEANQMICESLGGTFTVP